MAAINDLDIKMFDIRNVYLMVLVEFKKITKIRQVFGDDEGKLTTIFCTIDGLKLNGAAFR